MQIFLPSERTRLLPRSIDDATRRELGRAFLHLHNSPSVRTRQRPRGPTNTEQHNVWNRCHCRSSNRIHYHAVRVSLRYLCENPAHADVLAVSVIKTRMQSLEARNQYKNSFHCGYRILTEEGILRFWTGTTPRLARLVVSLGRSL